MDNVDLKVLKTIVAWRAEGRRVTIGTIVRTWGSAPRPVGAIVANVRAGRPGERRAAPPEIAVAILAEMTAVRYGYRIPEPVRL